jgi:hypothetical protein
MGANGMPFTHPAYAGHITYEPGLCPTAERMYFEELFYTDVCRAGVARSDLDDVVRAIEKVLDHASELALVS